MKNFIALLLVSCLSLFSAGHAKECSGEHSCDIFVDADGGLMQQIKGSNSVLINHIGDGSSAYSVYTIERSGVIYLVRDSTANDKSLIIVPLEKVGQKINFYRVLFFSIDMIESGKQGHNVWSGAEYNLPSERNISEFSWDMAYKWQESMRGTTGSYRRDIQSGFYYTKVDVYEGSVIQPKGRIYVYPEKFGLTADSLSCYTNCINRINLTGSLVGGIGKCPIQLQISSDAGKLSGSYKYQGKGDELYILGSVSNGGVFDLIEYSDKSLTMKSGSFSFTETQSVLIGSWVSEVSKKKLPFFVVNDAM